MAECLKEFSLDMEILKMPFLFLAFEEAGMLEKDAVSYYFE